MQGSGKQTKVDIKHLDFILNFLICYVERIVIFHKLHVLNCAERTHVDDRAVAGQAGAVVILCPHYNSVLISTVQLIPSAGGGVGETPVGAAVEPGCRGNVRFGTIARSPAD